MQKLLEAIQEMPVADTHEHLIPEEKRLTDFTDFFTITMSHYVSTDMISAGMPIEQMEQLRSDNTPFDEKVKLFLPYWAKTEIPPIAALFALRRVTCMG
jgi:glucuronate isomerase